MEDKTTQGDIPWDKVERAKLRQLLNRADGTYYEEPSKNPPLKYLVENSSPTGVKAVPVCIIDPTANPITMAIPGGLFNVVTGLYEAPRTPTVWKSVAATTTAATDIWAPAATKKFRLMGLAIFPDAGLLAAGAETITIIEETLGSFGVVVVTVLPIAASVVHQVPIVFDFGPNGYLSTTVAKKLQVTLSSAATAGAISITAWGTEE